MTGRSDKRLPTAHVHEARLRFFLPARRPEAMLERVVTTSWGARVVLKFRSAPVNRADGKDEIVGRPLGQQHADVLEAMRFTALAWEIDAVGRLAMLVDPAKVRRVARQVSTSTFRRVIDDLVATLIEIERPAHLACKGHLIDHIDMARRADDTPLTVRNPLGGNRPLWVIKVGEAAMRLFDADLALHHDPAPLAALRRGISAAVARWLIGQSVNRQPNGGWKLDTVIAAVCGEIGETDLKHRRRELLKDREALREIGIEVDGDRVHRSSKGPETEQQKPERRPAGAAKVRGSATSSGAIRPFQGPGQAALAAAQAETPAVARPKHKPQSVGGPALPCLPPVGGEGKT